MLSENEHLSGRRSRPELRDVTSTARLFNFRRPVYMTAAVWDDCVELKSVAQSGKSYDELAVLQRLRHVLFMAASALHGRHENVHFNFRVYRISNSSKKERGQPEPADLHLMACNDEHNRPIITIRFVDESI
jgi:hypothetical protein